MFGVCGLWFVVCGLVFGLNQPFEPFKPIELFKHFFSKRS
jgi:hypothetical protein